MSRRRHHPPAPAVPDPAAREELESLRARLAANEAATARSDVRIRELDKTTVLTAVGRKAGVRPAALVDFCNRAGKIFELDNGNLVACDESGPVFSKDDPRFLLSVTESARELRKHDRNYLWEGTE